MTVYSVDVYSGSNDSIIRDPKAQAVIVKATQGTGYVNPLCNHQVDLAKALKKKLGFYHYAGGGNPVSEADYFIDNIKNYVGQGMLILDWESYQNNSWGDYSWARRFVDRVHERTGVWCVIYVQESATAQVANCAKDCALWVAKYPSMNWHSWTIPNMAVSSGAFPVITGWQFTGDSADRSVWYIGLDDWDKFAKANVANPAPNKQPTVVKPAMTVPKTWVDDFNVTWHAEKATFKVTNGPLHLRWGASPTSSVIAVLNNGDEVKYDAWARCNGFVYIRQPRDNGSYGYVAVRDDKGEVYGTFK